MTTEVKIGYLVRYDHHLWLVTKYNGSWAWLERLEGGQVIKHDLSETTLAAEQVHDPSIGWGFLPLSRAVKLGWGGARKVMRGPVELEPLRDWVPSPASWAMPARGLYLPPTLKLTVGEVLVISYEKGNASMAKITQSFGTTAKRAADRMMKEHPPVPQSRWEIIKGL